MAWLYLLIAGVLEVGFTTFLKLSDSFTKFWPSLFFFLFSFASFWGLTKALEEIPLGVAYAIWTGIGAAGTVLIGMFFFGDSFNYLKLFFIVTLIGSILGLKLLS